MNDSVMNIGGGIAVQVSSGILSTALHCCYCLVPKSRLAPQWTVRHRSSVHGISQARILEWAAIPFSGGYFPPRDQTRVSCIGRWIFYPRATREAQNTIPRAQISLLSQSLAWLSRAQAHLSLTSGMIWSKLLKLLLHFLPL